MIFTGASSLAELTHNRSQLKMPAKQSASLWIFSERVAHPGGRLNTVNHDNS
jgi:hypothetical protein